MIVLVFLFVCDFVSLFRFSTVALFLFFFILNSSPAAALSFARAIRCVAVWRLKQFLLNCFVVWVCFALSLFILFFFFYLFKRKVSFVLLPTFCFVSFRFPFFFSSSKAKKKKREAKQNFSCVRSAHSTKMNKPTDVTFTVIYNAI